MFDSGIFNLIINENLIEFLKIRMKNLIDNAKKFAQITLHFEFPS